MVDDDEVKAQDGDFCKCPMSIDVMLELAVTEASVSCWNRRLVDHT